MVVGFRDSRCKLGAHPTRQDGVWELPPCCAGTGKIKMPLRRTETGDRSEEMPLGGNGNSRALDDLFSLTYEELRRLASSVRRGDPSATLNPTALVNEAWLKLAGSGNLVAESQLHFKRIAARAMRQLLVEAARRRHARKRGGDDDVEMIAFDESLAQTASCGKELLALDTALKELARVQPRQALMVESRFFGGLDINETATLLGVSEATILRDWRAAKAWLANALREVH
jgi:RNA polymerase sigma factor (TIGR02999 family)